MADAIEERDDHWAPDWLRPVSSRPRLVIAAIVGVGAALVAPQGWGGTTNWILGWDIGVIVFLSAVYWAWSTAEPHHVRKRAQLQDEGRHFMMVLVAAGVIASVAAIVFELTEAKTHKGLTEALQTAIGLGTVALSWLFLQTFFAQHYAHEYYATSRSEEGGEHGGLDFHGDEEPDYWDFFNFSVTLGATAATADVDITSKAMRQMVTWHTLMSYAFNTVVLALAISLLAGLF